MALLEAFDFLFKLLSQKIAIPKQDSADLWWPAVIATVGFLGVKFWEIGYGYFVERRKFKAALVLFICDAVVELEDKATNYSSEILHKHLKEIGSSSNFKFNMLPAQSEKYSNMISNYSHRMEPDEIQSILRCQQRGEELDGAMESISSDVFAAFPLDRKHKAYLRFVEALGKNYQASIQVLEVLQSRNRRLFNSLNISIEEGRIRNGKKPTYGSPGSYKLHGEKTLLDFSFIAEKEIAAQMEQAFAALEGKAQDQKTKLVEAKASA
ncbi:hypothetical protein [Rhizobium alvei]|uniref:Uncharacterized protein n=1 Tax=Rhizobium alvei TaxID=1132659 RepID=A0ABT8YIW6_9HYPH|nr:hypothetical protein [Rhizobium alvei]MDO6963456.1 hypothetical protein [Rhizobium alvei]